MPRKIPVRSMERMSAELGPGGTFNGGMPANGFMVIRSFTMKDIQVVTVNTSTSGRERQEVVTQGDEGVPFMPSSRKPTRGCDITSHLVPPCPNSTCYNR